MVTKKKNKVNQASSEVITNSGNHSGISSKIYARVFVAKKHVPQDQVQSGGQKQKLKQKDKDKILPSVVKKIEQPQSNGAPRPLKVFGQVPYKLGEFVPVTKDALDKVLKLMNRFEEEKRSVTLVFDSCFFSPDVTYGFIKTKYESIFGNIKRDQILIRTSAPRLMRDQLEAQNTRILLQNQAYIIAEEKLTEDVINRRAGAQGVFCCPMTLGCVINNLKKGIFNMNCNVLYDVVEQDNKKNSHKLSKESKKGPENSQPQNSQQTPLAPIVANQEKLNSSGKRNRIAASLNGLSAPKDTDKEVASNSTDIEVASNSTEKDSVKLGNKVNARLTKLLEAIAMCGDVVIRVDNLPAKLTVHALNLMMGTYAIKGNQIVACHGRKVKNCSLMNIRVVVDSSHEDMNRILNKNKCKTAYNTELRVERTDFIELRKFVIDNRNDLIHLETSPKLPLTAIGYSNSRQIE